MENSICISREYVSGNYGELVTEDGEVFEFEFVGDGNFGVYVWDVIKDGYIIGKITGKESNVIVWATEGKKTAKLLMEEEEKIQEDNEKERIDILPEIIITTPKGNIRNLKLDKSNRKVFINYVPFNLIKEKNIIETKLVRKYLASICAEYNEKIKDICISLSSDETNKIYEYLYGDTIKIELLKKYSVVDIHVKGESIHNMETWKMKDGSIQDLFINTVSK